MKPGTLGFMYEFGMADEGPGLAMTDKGYLVVKPWLSSATKGDLWVSVLRRQS